MRLLLAIATMIISLAVGAQTAGDIKPGFQEPEGYRFTVYNDHNGMSQWHLTRVLQDKHGYMWFATWNGLNRFDGYDFAVFKSRPGDGVGLQSDRIRNMMIGDDGHIYCVINDHVWRFNLNTYTFEKLSEEVQERYRARFKSDTVVKKAHNATVGGWPFDKVRQIFTDTQRNMWVMTEYGVTKVSPAPQPAAAVDAVPRDVIRSMYMDSKKRIWVTARNTGVVTLLDQEANLIGYLGTDGRLHPTPQRFGMIYCVTQQKNGTIWMGSKPDGLYRLKEVSEGTFNIEHLDKADDTAAKAGRSLNCNDIYDIKEDSKGRLWIATQGGGLNMIENPSASLNKGLEGSMRFHSPTNTFTSWPKTNMHMRRLIISGDSVILTTTTEGFVVACGMQKGPKAMNFNTHMRESDRSTSLGSSATMDMLIDRKGRLFISTESGGVNMYEGKDLTAQQFNFRHFTTQNGMGSDVAVAMTEIGDEILVQCNNQVSRINADLGTIENFNDLFFSAASQFSDAEPIMLPNGQWLLSMESGVRMISEQRFHQRTYVPRLVFTQLSVPGRATDYTVDTSDTILLTSRERNLMLQFAALDYTDNSHIKYITRLTQQHSWWQSKDSATWTTPSESRMVSYYDLVPGTYTLEVRSTNAEGLWVDNMRKVTIIVEPMFWETTLAYIIYILLFVGIISGITYTVVYIRNLEQKREENLRAYLRLFEQTNVPKPATLKVDANTTCNNKADGESEQLVQETDEDAPNAPNTPDSTDTDTDTPAASNETVVITATHLSEEDDKFMRRLTAFVDENMGNSNIGLDDMASAVATSRSSLNRKAKQLLGITPADFLKEARMKRAAQLLSTTQRSVNDIAYSCGFSDPKYFSKCFKASMGMSPSDYRSEHSDSV